MADTMNFEAAAFTALGTPREKVSLPQATFDGTVNVPVMQQAVKAQLANQRQANASTKTRGFVAGGNQKPWKQKGTGRARQGSTRAPNWPGGGTVFGPHGDRNYSQALPKQVRALARKSAFNARARENAVLVIDQFAYDAPKTSQLHQLLARLGVAHQNVLILTDGVKTNVYLSGRNLPKVRVLPYSDASTYDLLWSDTVLVEASAIGQTLAPVAEKAVVKVKVKKSGTPKTPKARKAAETSKKATAKKAAVKKAPAKKAAAKKAPAKPAASKKAPAKKAAAPKKKGK
ncbi:MAG: 50S ribosomal protein L4 [Gemmatimonadaceae bacterium]